MQFLAHFNTISEYGQSLTEDTKNSYFHQSLYCKSDSGHLFIWIELFKGDLLENIDRWTFHEAMTKFTCISDMNGTRRNVMHPWLVSVIAILVWIRRGEIERLAESVVATMATMVATVESLVPRSYSMMKPLETYGALY